MAWRPDPMAGRTSLMLSEGMTGLGENVFLNLKNRSKTITAEVEVPESGGNGAIIVQGGRFGGWALYVNERKVAEGRIERTQPMVFSADETANVGVDL